MSRGSSPGWDHRGRSRERLQHLDGNPQQRHRAEAPHHRGPAAFALANLGLTASLEILAREFSERCGIEAATSLEPVELDESGQLTIYWVVQESLTNVSKYAEAAQVEISVRDYSNHVEVEIRRRRQGFDVRSVKPSTHGLAGMRATAWKPLAAA